jgi:hypothetical protein
LNPSTLVSPVVDPLDHLNCTIATTCRTLFKVRFIRVNSELGDRNFAKVFLFEPICELLGVFFVETVVPPDRFLAVQSTISSITTMRDTEESRGFSDLSL